MLGKFPRQYEGSHSPEIVGHEQHEIMQSNQHIQAERQTEEAPQHKDADEAHIRKRMVDQRGPFGKKESAGEEELPRVRSQGQLAIPRIPQILHFIFGGTYQSRRELDECGGEEQDDATPVDHAGAKEATPAWTS